MSRRTVGRLLRRGGRRLRRGMVVALASLAATGLAGVLIQNVDGLHQTAGNRDVAELRAGLLGVVAGSALRRRGVIRGFHADIDLEAVIREGRRPHAGPEL